MKPLFLTMEAFGSYGKRTSINFEEPDQNLFLITGDTGAGKTTIFDAIVFALYGEASSALNRKDGPELQSQFAPPQAEPFVELIFSEGEGENKRIYRVRRAPRHRRPLKRGTGMKDVSETVSLTMPDGREYPPKETDRKLEELVGLTKAQFMQVAMIAQGEFMELLRAKSDDRKAIFRKLFHTERFQQIVEEFGRRRKEKDDEIRQIRTECRNEAARIPIPEDYEGGEELRIHQERIAGETSFVEEDLEHLMLQLEQLRRWLKQKLEQETEQLRSLSRIRDERRDQLTRAQELKDRYEQLNKAEEDLNVLLEQAGGIREKKELAEQIRKAYNLKEAYRRFQDEALRAEDIRERLRKQEALLPELKETARQAAEREEEEKKNLSRETEAFSSLSDRVRRNLDLFEKIAQAKGEADQAEKRLHRAREVFGKAQQQLNQLEIKKQQWKAEAEGLKDAQKNLILAQNGLKEAERLSREAGSVRILEGQVREQDKKSQNVLEQYAALREKYGIFSAEYEKVRQRFLDDQAGFLAGELKPGQPCPVCGSREHPAPCRRIEAETGIDRQYLKELEERREELRGRQEELSREARSQKALSEQKRKYFDEALEKFWGQLEEKGWKRIGTDWLKEGEEIVEAWKKKLKDETDRLQKQADRAAEVQADLERADRDISRQQEELEKAREEQNRESSLLEQSRTRVSTYEKEAEYSGRQEAEAILLDARIRKERAEKSFGEAGKDARAAEEKQNQSLTLIGRFKEELPFLIQKQEEMKHAYDGALSKSQLEEDQWKRLIRTYEREEPEQLDGQIQAYMESRAGLEAKVSSLKEAINGRQLPQLTRLSEELNSAEDQLGQARRSLEKWNQEYRSCQQVHEAMAPKLKKRQEAIRQYTSLDHLYRRLSGNVSGSRMDLETYVQRYYLEQILDGANRRFQEMSGGQFELRMYDLEKAGAGKNRGLDLMVWSALTGKEREIRTLSGGESFMAALSLALGMADRIQAGSSAVNLDILFIDEGFGSLDEHSRNQAVKVLQEMAGGSRMVGIISHVTELKQEIEDQLIVTRNEDGSAVRWKIS